MWIWESIPLWSVQACSFQIIIDCILAPTTYARVPLLGQVFVVLQASCGAMILKRTNYPKREQNTRYVSMTLDRISSILNASYPVEQAGFRPSQHCWDQVPCFTAFFENGFDLKNKISAAFLYLSVAYDTFCHKGVLVKFYNRIPSFLLQCLNSSGTVVL